MKPLTRRTMLGAGGVAAVGPLTALFPALAFGQATDSLTIAYNVALPSWDPTSGPSSVNPTLQALWKSVFDQFIDQNNDASFKPGLLTKWGWNADKSKVEMEVRSGALWHDGQPVTAQDIVWNLNRAADPKTGNPGGRDHLVERHQPEGRGQQDHRRRQAVRRRSLQVDGLPHRLRDPAAALREGRRGRLREAADRLGPVPWSTSSSPARTSS